MVADLTNGEYHPSHKDQQYDDKDREEATDVESEVIAEVPMQDLSHVSHHD